MEKMEFFKNYQISKSSLVDIKGGKDTGGGFDLVGTVNNGDGTASLVYMTYTHDSVDCNGNTSYFSPLNSQTKL